MLNHTHMNGHNKMRHAIYFIVRKLIKSMIDLERKNEPERKWTCTEKTISMLEFAGQWGYYATHQIYFNCKSFFIFVMDLSKPLETIVEDTANKGTLFEQWTYKGKLIWISVNLNFIKMSIVSVIKACFRNFW